MKNLAPEIFRQRLLVEGYYTIESAAIEFARRYFGIAGDIASASI